MKLCLIVGELREQALATTGEALTVVEESKM